MLTDGEVRKSWSQRGLDTRLVRTVNDAGYLYFLDIKNQNLYNKNIIRKCGVTANAVSLPPAAYNLTVEM